MLNIEGNACRFCDGISRREFIQIGGLSLLGFTLADFFRLKEAGAVNAPKYKACILLYMPGAPSHLDTFDPKPEAPAEYRGEFGVIETNVPGIRIGEHLPRIAKHADKFAIVRSVTHGDGAHPSAMHLALTGYGQRTTEQYPHIGSMVAKLRNADIALPPNVQLPGRFTDGGPVMGQTGGFLGRVYDPFIITTTDNNNQKNYDFRLPELSPTVSLSRLAARRGLRAVVDTLFRQVETTQMLEQMDSSYQRAFALLTSPEAKKAFDLNEEKPELRDRYGRTKFGQGCLLARRLVERGVPFVTVGSGPDTNNPGGFDTHQNNFPRLKNDLLPPVDQGFAALLEDLKQRGLLEHTLVVWMGEFGRTPRINGSAGRDHWPQCYSVVLAGGGIKGGQVVGSSDARGEYPQDRPVGPWDVHATIYHALGFDPEETFIEVGGRPVRIFEHGKVIRELV